MINGRNRVRFIKANSKSKNPIIYIKSDKEYITYKSFLRKRKVRGGGEETYYVTNFNHTQLVNLLHSIKEKDPENIYGGFKTYLSIKYIKTDNTSYQVDFQSFNINSGEKFFIDWENIKKYNKLNFADFYKLYVDDDENIDKKNKISKIVSITLTKTPRLKNTINVTNSTLREIKQYLKQYLNDNKDKKANLLIVYNKDSEQKQFVIPNVTKDIFLFQIINGSKYIDRGDNDSLQSAIISYYKELENSIDNISLIFYSISD